MISIEIPKQRPIKYLFTVIYILMYLSGCGEVQKVNMPEEIRLGFMPDFTNAHVFVGIDNKQYQLNLRGSNFIPKGYLANSALMNDIKRGELDIAFVDPISAIIAHSRSDRNQIRIIGGVSSGGNLFVSQREIPPDALKDFRGKIIAVPEYNVGQHLALRDYFISNGLDLSDPRHRINITPLDRSEIITSFSQNLITAAWVTEPWASKLIVEEGGYPFINESSLWTKSIYSTVVIVVRNDFLIQYPEAIFKFMESHIKITVWIRSHKNETLEILRKGILSLINENISKEVGEKAYRNFVSTYDPVRPSLLKMAARAKRFGLINDKNIDDLFNFTAADSLLKYMYLPPLKLIIN